MKDQKLEKTEISCAMLKTQLQQPATKQEYQQKKNGLLLLSLALMYGHRYYLTKEEQNKYEPGLERIAEVDEEVEEPKNKKPRSLESYQSYR